MADNAIKPGIWLYFLSIFIFFGGITLFIVFLFVRIYGISSGLTQVKIPGAAELTLSDSGGYTVFLEKQSTLSGQIFDVSALNCKLANKETAEELPLVPATSNSNYNINGRSGVSILEFNLDKPGVYRFSAVYPAGQSGPTAVLAIGHGFLTQLFVTIFGGFVILGGSIFLSFVLGIWTFIKRYQAKQALAPAPPER